MTDLDTTAGNPLVALANMPEVLEFMRRLNAVAGCSSTSTAFVVFQRAREWLSRDPRTRQLERLESKRCHFPGESDRTRYESLRNGLWPEGDVHTGLRRVRYHMENVERIECSIVAAAKETGVLARFQEARAFMGGGNTVALDSEYQAFVLGARACLDNFARTIAAYFADDSHSFHDMPKNLARMNPRSVADRVARVLGPHHEGLACFYSEGQAPRCVRDRIVHREFVRAGCLQVNGGGVYLADIPEAAVSEYGRLVPILQRHIVRIEEVVVAVVDELIAADLALT